MATPRPFSFSSWALAQQPLLRQTRLDRSWLQALCLAWDLGPVARPDQAKWRHVETLDVDCSLFQSRGVEYWGTPKLLET